MRITLSLVQIANRLRTCFKSEIESILSISKPFEFPFQSISHARYNHVVTTIPMKIIVAYCTSNFRFDFETRWWRTIPLPKDNNSCFFLLLLIIHKCTINCYTFQIGFLYLYCYPKSTQTCATTFPVLTWMNKKQLKVCVILVF